MARSLKSFFLGGFFRKEHVKGFDDSTIDLPPATVVDNVGSPSVQSDVIALPSVPITAGSSSDLVADAQADGTAAVPEALRRSPILFGRFENLFRGS